MSFDQRSGARNRRPLYAPPSRGGGSQHSLLGYWVPLVVTGTLAVGGLAAWIWSERSEDDEDEYPDEKPHRPPPGSGGPAYPGPPGGQPKSMPPYQGPTPSQSAGPQGGLPQGPAPPGGEAASYYGAGAGPSQRRDVAAQDEGSWYARIGGMVRRSPSPQQFFDNASRQVNAGMAAAGSALGSIMEEDNGGYYDERRQSRSGQRRAERREEREGFSDHERWSEEADEKRRTDDVEAASERRADAVRSGREERGKGRAKRSVAVVVNADTPSQPSAGDDADFRTEHGSILSHLPSHHDPEQVDLFVLIYSPDLQSLPPVDYKPNATSSALGSSYSQTSASPVATPGSELQSMSPRVQSRDRSTAPSKTFDALYNQALALVAHPTHILPFTTQEGYVHILRHLAPPLVYLSDTLAGDEGEHVAQLSGWVGRTVLVAGDGGHGGLADTETETEDEGGHARGEKRRWWEGSVMVGLGKAVDVVDAGRVGEDWSRRVAGRE